MGTNYYVAENVCPCCKRSEHTYHIGKSRSAGWCFAVHQIPELGLWDWPQWKEFLRLEDRSKRITNGYGDAVTLEELTNIVEDRKWVQRHLSSNLSIRLRDNHAEEGPNGLMRSKVDGSHCIAHGAGTWDVIAGEFS